ncbi:MAG TPA: hypothetical protein VEU74_11125 [Gemmatimonadales bacterium]|nr:hypothetical protein [Gemmatimonadales bacterium]
MKAGEHDALRLFNHHAADLTASAHATDVEVLEEIRRLRAE